MVLLCVFPDLSHSFFRCPQPVTTGLPPKHLHLPPASVDARWSKPDSASGRGSPSRSWRRVRWIFMLEWFFREKSTGNHYPWRIHGAGILMLTWLGYMDGKCYHIYIAYMDPMGYKWWYIPWIPVKIFPEKGLFSRENLNRKPRQKQCW